MIRIDEEKCIGCGACAESCAEGVIEIIDGKAKVVREDHCDGLGACMPVCPTDAITVEETLACGCGGDHVQTIERCEVETVTVNETQSQLRQFPIKMKLIPPNAPYLNGAKLLIAADCTAYAYGNFHNKFIRNHITLIGCPKLDDIDYSTKLTAILKSNDIKSITITRMEVPCCSGIVTAVTTALKNSGKMIPWQVVTISRDGKIID